MKVTILGTAASPSVPIPFCTCKVCKDAIAKKGKNLRKKSSILINDDLLVDLGPDLPISFVAYKIDTAKIKYCLQTHLHDDHFYPELLNSRHSDYGTKIGEVITLISSIENITEIGRKIFYQEIDLSSGSFESPDLKVLLKPIDQMKTYQIGKYSITAFLANHGKGFECFNYLIECDGVSVFYAVDTSLIYEATWQYLIENRKSIDVLIMDHTYGFGFESRNLDHLAMKDFIGHSQRFRDENILKKSGKILATHISHQGILSHGKLNEFAKRNGYQIAFDGQEIFA